MTTIALNQHEQSSLRKIQHALKTWCSANPVPLGVVQVAVGAALVALGVKTGAIEMGSALLATHTPIVNIGSIVGAAGAGAGGGWAGAILGGIGVAAGGTAIGIPAALVAGGAACVFGLAGYAVGDIAHNILAPETGVLPLVLPGSLLTLGAYLIVRGSTNVLSGTGVASTFRSGMSQARDSLLMLRPLSAETLAATKAELAGFAAEWSTPSQSRPEMIAASAAVIGCSAGGIVAGSAMATASVSVMGSSFLGSLAVSAGLVSAPLWPVVAGAAVAGGLGFTAMKACRYLAKRKSR